MRPRRRSRSPVLILAVLAGCTVEPAKPVPEPVSTPPSSPPGASKAAARAITPANTPPELLSSKSLASVDVSSLMNRVVHWLDTGNYPAALRTLDEVLAADPTNRKALSMTTMITQNQAAQVKRPASSPLFLKSADAMRKILALKVELSADEKRYLPQVLYNEACTLALAGEADRALKSLSESVDAGFELADHFDTDTDLDSLRKLPAFQALQQKLERKAVGSRIAANTPWRFDFRLPDLDGKAFAFDDVKGKLTVVDFWGTWCAPCRKEVPHLVELAKRYREKGLKVVGLNYEGDDSESSRQAVREFVKKYGVTYTCLVGDSATKRLVPKFEGYPTTLFVDDRGQVRLQLTGYQSFPALETAVNALLEPVKEKPRESAAVKGKEKADATSAGKK